MSGSKGELRISPRQELPVASRYAARSLSLIALMLLAGLLGISVVVFAHYSLRALADVSETHFSAWERAIDNGKFLGDQNPGAPLPTHVLRDAVIILSADQSFIQSIESKVRLSLRGSGVKLAFLLSASPEDAQTIQAADVPSDVKTYLHNLTIIPLEILPAIVSGLDVVTSIKIQSRKALAPLAARRAALQRALAKSVSIVWFVTLATSGAVLLGMYATWVMLLKPPLAQLDDAIIQVRRSERQLQTTLDAIGDGVIATNSNLEIISMNPSAQALTGWPFAAARGKPLGDVVKLEAQHSDGGAPEAVNVTRLAVPGYSPAGNYSLISRNGVKYRIAESVAPLRLDEHNLYGIVIVLRDVTQQLALQRKVDRKVRLQAIGELASGVAHDFNNLLGIIIGTSSLAIRQDDAKPVKNRFEAILQAARTGASLTENLLSFARSSPSVPIVQSIHAILHRTAINAQETYGPKCQISIACRPDLEAEVDGERLQTALMNLIMSALETASGSRKVLLLAYGEIRNDVNCLTICVEDDGYVAPAPQLPQQAEAFFPKKSITRSRGLGVPMAAAFVEQAGGELRIDSSAERRRTSVFMHFPTGARL